MRLTIYLAWICISFPTALWWLSNIVAAYEIYGALAAIGLALLDLTAFAAAAWLVFDLFLRPRPTKAGDDANADTDDDTALVSANDNTPGQAT